LDGERFDPKFLARKKKQRENVNIVEKKQRMKRMKVQKEKKEKKARGEVDEDGDIEMEDAPVTEKKKPKVKGTEIAKIKPKRSATAVSGDEPILKKKKKTAASEEKDLFFLKPEDKPVVAKKVKKVKSTTSSKEVTPKKVVTDAPAAVPVVEAPAAIQKPQTKAQTGVVGVVDKTKKVLKSGNKKTDDIIAALESESKKKEDISTGTGLDVGGWD
jgi:hypothetical protein